MRNQTFARPLPFFFVGKSVTTDRVNNYLQHKHTLLSDGIGKPDTRNIWYSKEHIVKLLEEIEYMGGDGLRIQFGMYEDSHEYAGQLCILMNITREKMVGNSIVHKNIALELEPEFAERSSLPREIIIFPGDDENGSIGRDFNYGSPCPPRCDTFDPNE